MPVLIPYDDFDDEGMKIIINGKIYTEEDINDHIGFTTNYSDNLKLGIEKLGIKNFNPEYVYVKIIGRVITIYIVSNENDIFNNETNIFEKKKIVLASVKGKNNKILDLYSGLVQKLGWGTYMLCLFLILSNSTEVFDLHSTQSAVVFYSKFGFINNGTDFVLEKEKLADKLTECKMIIKNKKIKEIDIKFTINFNNTIYKKISYERLIDIVVNNKNLAEDQQPNVDELESLIRTVLIVFKNETILYSNNDVQSVIVECFKKAMFFTDVKKEYIQEYNKKKYKISILKEKDYKQ